MKTNSQHACTPINLDRRRIYYLTQPQLVRINEESIRLGFTRNLIERMVARLPAHFKFPLLHAWNHTSGEGLKNIRLEILVGCRDDINYCFLDVTPDAWAKIRKQGTSTRTVARLRVAAAAAENTD